MDEKIAHKAYGKILRLILKEVGSEMTWTEQLNSLGQALLGKKYQGAFPYNHVPTLTKSRPYAIVNTDDSDGPGEHWIAVANTKTGARAVYDSFGRKSSKILRKMKGKKIDADSDAEQKDHEDSCGQRCIAWLVFVDIYGVKAGLLI